MAVTTNFATAVTALVNSLTDAEKLKFNELIYQSVFEVSDISRSHELRTGVRNGNLIPILLNQDEFGAMSAGDETDCELNECNLPMNFSTKKWTLGEYNCRVEVCMRNFTEDFLVFWNAYRQRLDNPLEEPDAQAIIEYLTEKVIRRAKGALWRTTYLGDTASVNSLISKNDGFFTQAEAGSGIKININDADPTAEEIYDTLQSAYEQSAGSGLLWATETDLVWKMTYAMASKLVAFLNTKADLSQYNCDCVNPDAIVAGRRFSVEGLRIFGIPVEAHREIDGSLTALSRTDKFQALLARRSNLLIGTNTTDKMDMMDIFFDKVTRKVFIDSMIYVGASIPLDSEYVYISNEVSS